MTNLRVSPNEVNLDTDNFVIIWYYNYAGGKTLLNCLALNDGALFPDKTFAEMQMRGEFTVDDKMNYIRTELSKLKKGDFWNDLNLSCDNFFGLKKKEYINPFRGIRFHRVVKEASESNYKFYMATHFRPELEAVLKIWHKPKVILFDHVESFIKKRCEFNPRVRKFYDMLPNFRKDFEELAQYKQVICHFDTRAYDKEETMIEEVERVYNVLQLPNFNKAYIAEYYNLWIQKVNELS
jgi:hypothetical protein